MLVFVFIAVADTTIVNTGGLSFTPTDAKVIYLFDGTDDVIQDSTFVTFGPYSMSGARGNKMYKGYQFYAGALGGTTPEAGFAYQLSWSSDTADIIAANWVTTDTIPSAGTTDYVDLSSKSAKFIYFRVHNYDATYDTMGVLNVIMKKNE